MTTTTSWPSWPEGEEGEVIGDYRVSKSVDDLFLLVFPGLNEYREKMNEESNYQNYAVSGWKNTEEEARAALSSADRPCVTSISEVKQGMVMIRSFGSPSSLGSVYPTTEHLQITELDPGRLIVVQTCVATAAPYGEKFRVLTLHRLEALDPQTMRFTAKFYMNYLSSVNGMIKGIIEKGAKGGLKKAGEATVKILGTYADVTPMSEAGPLPPSPTAQEANAQEQAPAPPAPAPNAAVQLQEAVFGAGVVEALEPWASLLHAMLAHLPLLGGLTMPIVLGLLCSIFTLGALRLALAVLRFFESAGREPEDVFAWLAHHVFRVVHVPSSMVEALMTYAFVLLVSKAINRVAPGLPGPPMSHNGQKTPSRRGISASPEDGGSLSGVKYDGYNTAMAKAKIDLENNHSKGKETLDAINNRSEVALRTIQKGLVRVAAPFTPKEGGGKAHKAHRTHRNHHRPGHRANKAKVAGSSGDHRDIHNHRNSHAAHRFPGVFLTEGPPRSSNGDTNASEGANGSESYDGSEGHVMLPQGYNPPDLPAALRGQTYVEVLYENQRLQPFRGWGHTWPGHFLPTDRAMRWSRCDADGNDVDASQELEEVAPKLPEGWRWVEAEWQLDLSGVLSDSTDNEGWSYGLDFPWVVYPFAPGTGRKKLADFVRRRRWLRTRVRLLSEVPEEEGTEEGGAALGGTTVAPDADAPADAPVEPEAPGGVEVARQLMSIALQRELGTGAEASSASAIWRSSAIVKEDAVYDTGLERMQTPQEYFDTSSSEEDDDDDDDDEDEDEDDDEDADGSFSDGSSREYSREGGSSGQRSQEMDAGEGSGGQGSVASGQYAEGGSGEGASPVAGSPKGAPVQLELPRDRFKASQQVGGEDDGGAE